MRGRLGHINLGGACQVATVPPLRGQRSQTERRKMLAASVGMTEKRRFYFRALPSARALG